MAVHTPAAPVATLLLLTGVLAVAVPTMVLRHANVTAVSGSSNGTGTVTGTAPTASGPSTSSGSAGSSSSGTSGSSAASGSSGSTGPSAQPGSAGSSAKTPAADKGVFGIAGSVAGLVPGVAKPMTVTITNPNGYSIQVRSVNATVGPTGDPRCPAGVLSVVPYADTTTGPPVVAPGRGTTTLTMSVLLADSLTADTSGCTGTTIPLSFTGTAEKGK